VGTASHYAEALRLIRARIEALNLTFDSVDALAGFPLHYCATLLCERRAMSVYSFFSMIGALGLRLEFQHDAAQLETLRERQDWIEFRRKGARYRPKLNGTKHRPVTFKIYPDLMRKRALLSVKARMEKLTPARRRKIARHAAMARWGSNGNHPPK
jgi:hypothetical protein